MLRSKPTFVKVSVGDYSFLPRDIVSSNFFLVVALTNHSKHVHNFTLEALHIDIDLPPGEVLNEQFALPNTGQFEFYCKYHRARGMTGTVRFGRETNSLEQRS